MTFFDCKNDRPDFCVFGKTKRTPQNGEFDGFFSFPKQATFEALQFLSSRTLAEAILKWGTEVGILFVVFLLAIFQKEHLTRKKWQKLMT